MNHGIVPRILGALWLAPLTQSDLARMLDTNPTSIGSAIQRMRKRNEIRPVGVAPLRTGKHRRAGLKPILWGLA